MKVSMIAAMDKNLVIGRAGGGIPWHLPRDTAHFRSYTAGKYLLLGRTTFQEMDGWFTDQIPIVITSKSNFLVPGGHKADSITDGIAIAKAQGAEELVVCGGASIYRATLPFARELILTQVETGVQERNPRKFPDYESMGRWKKVRDDSFPADDENRFAMRFLKLERADS